MGRLDAAREQFTLAEEAAAAQPDDAVNNLLGIATTRFECGDAEGAEATFARAQAEGQKKLSETGHLGSIFQLVTLATVRSKVGMKDQALAKLSEAVAAVDRVAESSTRSILESYFYEKFLAAIARGYAAVGALQEATDIVGRMSDKEELLQAVGYVASALRDAGREAEAVDLIEAALTKRADPGPELVSLTAELLKTLADKATAGRQSAAAGAALLGAENLLRESGQKMSRVKSLWDIHLWQAFLGQREAAGRGFDRLQQEVQAIPEAAQGTLYREIMETFLKQPRDASGSIIFVDTFESHINNPELRRFWSLTIRDLCRELGPRPDEVEDNFREAQELLQSGLELYRASNYTEMAVVYWRGDRGSGLLRESIHALLTLALNTVFADAKRTPEYGLDWVRLSNVLMTAGWVGEYEWAAQTGLVAEVETLQFRDWILFDHAEFNRRQGQFAAATNLAQAIERGRLSAYALSMIVQAEAKAGAGPAQATGLEPLRQLVRNTSDPKERASCLVALAAALAGVGLVDDGIQALEDAADELAEVIVWDREDPLKLRKEDAR
jgi:tetratricopeptide (TPR) repeat protein